MARMSHIPGLCLSLSVCLSIFLPLSACLPVLWRREGCLASQAQSETKTDSRERGEAVSSTDRDKEKEGEQQTCVGTQFGLDGCLLISLNYGEVSDPDQDQGECSVAHGQSLLSRCECARAVSGTQALGQGSGAPTALSRPPWGFFHLRLWSWVGTELQDPFQTSCPTPTPRPQPTSQLCR